MDHTQVFSHPRWRPLTMALHLIVLVTISSLAARRTPDSVAKWRAASATSLAVCFTLIDSLIFVGLATFVVFGLGSSRSLGVCSFGRYLCTFFYIGAKLTTSWFLIERARLVTNPLTPRLRNRFYLFNLSLPAIWVSALVLALLYNTSRIRGNDGECLIGLDRGVLGTMIGTEVFLNVYYTALFVVPLMRGKYSNPRIRRLARHSALAAVLTVTSSVANMVVFILHRGVELSWACLAMCTLDTVWCAVVLCVLTGRRDDEEASEVGTASRTGGGTTGSFAWRKTGERSLGGGERGGVRAHLGVEVPPLARQGSFGRMELGDGEGGAGGYYLAPGGAGGGARRGSVAPEDMCLDAIENGEVARTGVGWQRRPSRDRSESESEEEKLGAHGEQDLRVEFAPTLAKGTG